MPTIPNTLKGIPRLYDAIGNAVGGLVYLNVDFGGQHGEKLALLNRIVGFFDVEYSHMKGLSFSYDDGTEQLYGSCQYLTEAAVHQPCYTISFVVDGKRGERVDTVKVFTTSWQETPFVEGIQVCFDAT
ncbi:hypothetical protein IMZ48_08010 [Candidatus Bathyarchaeota archaeon]|nr:hypothetical protein [Candidatus Bathyarchaeota archaeon]